MARISKFSLFGNSCVGKTTVMHYAFSELKLAKHRVGAVADLARRVVFPPNMFDKSPEARLHVLFAQLASETELVVRKDVEVLLSERCVLDWWLHYQWTCRSIGVPMNKSVESLVGEWLGTYSVIYYLPEDEIELVDDGYRGPNSLRQALSPMYKAAAEYSKSFGNIVLVDARSFEDRCTFVAAHMLKTLGSSAAQEKTDALT